MKTMVFEGEQAYICHDGRELRHINIEKKKQHNKKMQKQNFNQSDFMPKNR